jgi:uncharacterized glyoxalase superfamily protein PhnB
MPSVLRERELLGRRMAMKVQSYLSFEGRTEEALDFYKRTLGAKVEQMMRYKDVAEAREHAPPGGADKVMHCAFKIGDTQLMASDGMNTGKPNFAGISLRSPCATTPRPSGRSMHWAMAGKCRWR